MILIDQSFEATFLGRDSIFWRTNALNCITCLLCLICALSCNLPKPNFAFFMKLRPGIKDSMHPLLHKTCRAEAAAFVQ